MGWVAKELRLCGEVPSGAESTWANTEVIPNGKRVEVIHLCGHGPGTVNSVIKAVWDYEGAGEDVIWSTKNDANDEIYYAAVGDGIKELAIVLENGEDGPIVMSGCTKYVEET